jgi:predicted nucleic acid-binding protein
MICLKRIFLKRLKEGLQRGGVKDKKIVKQMLNFWVESNLEIVDCYLVACLEGDKQNILYSYDKDFDKFKILRKEP